MSTRKENPSKPRVEALTFNSKFCITTQLLIFFSTSLDVIHPKVPSNLSSFPKNLLVPILNNTTKRFPGRTGTLVAQSKVWTLHTILILKLYLYNFSYIIGLQPRI